jgi:hyperosmotically inducible periplasmic protein
MSFRLGALLCLSGIAACTHHTNEAARDPTYTEGTTDSQMVPASLETDQTTPSSNVENKHEHGNTPPPVADLDDKRSYEDRTKEPTPSGTVPADPSKASAPPPVVPGPVAPDNTKVNKRDRADTALTPMDQKNNQTDLDITQKIRQAVMGDSSLSFTAKNVKIITQNGKVTLRGPVNTAEERSAIEAAARKVAGAQVDNQIEVKK